MDLQSLGKMPPSTRGLHRWQVRRESIVDVYTRESLPRARRRLLGRSGLAWIGLL